MRIFFYILNVNLLKKFIAKLKNASKSKFIWKRYLPKKTLFSNFFFELTRYYKLRRSGFYQSYNWIFLLQKLTYMALFGNFWSFSEFVANNKSVFLAFSLEPTFFRPIFSRGKEVFERKVWKFHEIFPAIEIHSRKHKSTSFTEHR